MKLEQAIDRNVELKGELTREGRLEKAKAVNLAIEALKRCQHARKEPSFVGPGLLPGETEE